MYGDQARGTITEDTPLDVRKGWDYAESKHAAEQIVLEAAAKGLPAVVLRIAVVYGPHNLTIVARPLRHLMEGRLFLIECKDVPSNTIYIDNLCEAIRRSLDGGPELNGQTFVLSDDDGYTWGEYFGYFASQLGATIHYPARVASSGAAAAEPSMLSRWLRGTRDLVLSSEVKQLAKRVYLSEPWGTPARWGLETFPNAAERLKRMIRPEEGFIYRPNPVEDAQLPPFTMDPITARVISDKARRMLEFTPVVSRARAMELTFAWARFARIVPSPAAEEIGAPR
jgi:uncharacterized protein YbjT (DUF2867 family)